MSSSLPNYDNWLVAPMLDRMEAAEIFMDWCEEHNIEFDDPEAEVMYQDYIEGQYADYPEDDEPDEYPYWMTEGDYE